MGKQFRVRVHAKNAPNKIRKGTSSNSNPGFSKNREIAKATRAAIRQRLIAVDDRVESESSRRPHIEKALAEPLENMDFDHKPEKEKKKQLKRTLSMTSLTDYDEETVGGKKEPELYPNMVITPVELETKISRIGQMLSSAVNARTKQRQKLLSEVRSILKQVESLGMPTEHVDVVSRYAKSFLPLFFRIYTDVPANQSERLPNNDKDMKLSAFETVRMYMAFVPQDLADVHANLALKKLQDESISDERKLLVVNILVALCRRVGNDGATNIFNQIHPWFLSDPKRKSLQKKAYRILTELYKRRNDPQLAPFFEYIQPTVGDILRLEMKQISEPAWAARLAVFRLILRSLENLKLCEQFYNTILSQIIIGMDRSHNSLTRQNAAKCFQELVNRMLSFCEDKEDKESLRLQILDSVETRIFEFSGFITQSSEVAMEVARSTLIAMNIFAQQQLKHMNGALVSRFLNHAIVFLADNRPVIRVLAIRLLRVFCKKMPAFMISQFQDYILESVFSNQSESENTGTIRRANRFLFEILIEKFGYEVVCKYAQGQEGMLKFLKTLEKKRRRKLAPPSDKAKSTRSAVNADDSDSGEEEDKMTAVSQARTICADSIFKLLEESDEAPSDEDDDDVKSRVAQSMVSIKEFRKALHRSETAAAQKVNKSKKLPKGLHIAEDGRLVVEDLEAADDEEDSDEDENDY